MFRLLIHIYAQFCFFRKESGNSFSTTLDNMCIAIAFLSGCDVINFKNFSFFCMTKSQDKNLKPGERKETDDLKDIFHEFPRALSCPIWLIVNTSVGYK